MSKKKKLTPMMQQYMDIKKNTEEALVFFRLGDFYELFYEDAEIASRVLDLVLTARGGEDRIPMCGVPHHAAKSYIQKLVANGYKVAIVEQVEDPKEAKGLVRREVVEIVTPGTYFEMDDNESREIASLSQDIIYASIVSCDVMSGNLRGIRVMNDDVEIIKHLQQFQVKELVVTQDISANLIQKIEENTDIYISYHDDKKEGEHHEDHFFNDALASLLSYLAGTQSSALLHLADLEILNEKEYLKMDYTSMNNLELIHHDKKQELSVYRFMDHTQTSMGSRLLKEVLMRPLLDVEAINKRHRQIELFMEDYILRDELKSELKQVYDVHRIVARITGNKHNPQDFVRLKQSIAVFHRLQDRFSNYDDFEFLEQTPPLYEVHQKLDEAFRDDAPVQFKEGKTFKEGIHPELDELVSLSEHGDSWLLEYEQAEREKTGIKNLKVGYTRAFGYYIEISKGQVQHVKDEFAYIRKQTLTNSERYISDELQDFEVKINEAKERILYLEQKLFDEYTAYISDYSRQLHQLAQALSYLDVLLSLSEFSHRPGYVKPELHERKELYIQEGRHPVLEASLEDKQYISSDVHFDEKRQILVLTGPNMGGKSTYMRMLAVNVILAQVGAYIPAEKASIGIVDQIFTRMGASDDILMGQSTFMVEMLESQLALSQASENSLILFDEIGRGTSTYDGMAIAQAIIEYIHEKVKSRTVFSTHYHELVALEDLYERIYNIHAQVHEEEKKITFLYKVVPGRSTKSYGINVARLAQLPQVVIDRAEDNLEILEMNREEKNISKGFVLKEVVPEELKELQNTLKDIDVNSMTPMEALLFLSEIQKNLEGND